MFTRLYTQAQVRLATRNEEGQGTLEYIGMILLAGLLIGGLIAIFEAKSGTISDGVGTLMDKIAGLGG